MKKRESVFEPVIPVGSFGAPDEAIIELLEKDILPKALGRNYSNITFKEAGGTKYIFQAKWAGGQKRIIKVDRPDHDLESPRAQRNVAKGYTTQHEIRMVASIPDPYEHGILPPIDFCDLREFRYPGAMLVEDHFESISLEKRVKDGKSLLSREAFQEYALQIAKTLSFMTEEQGIVHRDLNPGNILLGVKKKGKARAIITDWANAGRIDSLEQRIDPTGGSVKVTDWRLMHEFTGKDAQYSVQSEIYAFGMNLFYALTNKSFVEIDPDQKFARVTSTGESLLDKTGKIDKMRYDQALQEELSKIGKGWRRDYISVLRKCLTGDLESRYDTFSQVVKDLERKEAFTLPVMLKRYWKGTLMATLAAGLFFAGSNIIRENNAQREKETAVFRALEQRILSKVDEREGNLQVIKNEHFDFSVPYAYSEGGQAYPERSFLFLNDKNTNDNLITIYPFLEKRGIPLDVLKQGSSVEVKMYLEGVPQTEVVNTSRIEAGGDIEKERAGIVFPIRGDIKPGTYSLAIETYGPISADVRMGTNAFARVPNSYFAYRNLDEVLTRMTIPLIINEPEEAVRLSQIRPDTKYTLFGVSKLVRNQGIEKEYKKDETIAFESGGFPGLGGSVVTEWHLPSYNYKTNFPGSIGLNLKLPSPQREGEKDTLYCIVRKGTNVLHVTGVPLVSIQEKENVQQVIDTVFEKEIKPIYNWKKGIHNRDFQRDLIRFREQYAPLK